MDKAVGVKNYMEDLILSRMPEVLRSIPDVCMCERCHMDRLAYALNNLPPKYVVTPKGKLYAKLNTLEGQFSADVTRVIMDAAIRVDQYPRHDDDDE